MDKAAKNLVTKISDGVLGFLLYECRTNSSYANSEYLIYYPISKIVDSEKWVIKPQFFLSKFKEKKSKGIPNSLDFLFSHRNKSLIVGMEIKYIKNRSKPEPILANDLKKLEHCLNTNNEEDQIHYGIVLLTGHLDLFIDIDKNGTFDISDKLNSFCSKYGLDILYKNLCKIYNGGCYGCIALIKNN